MRMPTYIVSLTLQLDEQLIQTVNSASQFAKQNSTLFFHHLIICPKKNEIHFGKQYETDNYRLEVLKDPGLGIYHAFNFAIQNITGNGYVIFLAAGDQFLNNLRMDPAIFESNYSLISFATIIKGKSVEFIYKPNISEYMRNTIPHSSLFTRISDIRQQGLFLESLGSAGDFYLTASIMQCSTSKIHVDTRPITIFNLGGVSSGRKGIIDYARAIGLMKTSPLRRAYLVSRKIISYMKYSI
jgi:hypothetical protein